MTSPVVEVRTCFCDLPSGGRLLVTAWWLAHRNIFLAKNRHWRRALGLQHHLYDQFFTLIPILTELRPNSAKNGSKSTIFIFHSKNAFFREVFFSRSGGPGPGARPGGPAGRQAGRPAGQQAGRQAGQPAGWLAGMPASQPAGWPACRPACWPAGRPACRPAGPPGRAPGPGPPEREKKTSLKNAFLE